MARVWCYETAVLLDQPDIDNEIPFHNYYEYFAPNYELHLLPQKMENMNDKAKIDEIRTDLLQQLQELQGAPGVSMQIVPPLYERRDHNDEQDDVEEDSNQDEGLKTRIKRKEKKQHESELFEKMD